MLETPSNASQNTSHVTKLYFLLQNLFSYQLSIKLHMLGSTINNKIPYN